MPEKNSLKICFFNSTKIWGGGEKWHFDMATQLNKLGYDICFAANKKSKLAHHLKDTGISYQTFRIGNLSFLNICKLLLLRRYFRREKISMVVMNLPSDIKAAGIAAKWAGVNRIVYRRGSAVPIKDSYLNRYLFSRVLTDVIANSEATRNTIVERNRNLFAKEKIKVLYNGIDLTKTANVPKKRLYTPVSNEIVLGNVGRMVYQKGHEFLLDIACQLKSRGIPFRLLLAGSGLLEAEIRHRADLLNLNEDILFLGFVEDIPSFMDSIDIFLLTSRWEGFGFVLAEAMAAAKPIVAFDISSNPELVSHGVNGYLAEPFDTGKFTYYLTELINNPKLRHDFGTKGLELVKEKFTMERVVNGFIEWATH